MGKKQMRQRRKPSFFKVLLGDFSKRLRIPPYFIKHFNGTFPTNFILRSPNGKCWRVMVKKTKDNWFFRNGWRGFVRYHSLEVGEFLVFKYKGKSKFSVTIYDRSACEKELPLTKRNSYKPNSHKKKGEEEAMIDKFAKKASVCGKMSCGSIISMRRTRSIQTNRALDAVVSIFKTEHPYFILVCRRSRKYKVTVPRALAVDNGLKNKESTVLQDPCGRLWIVKISLRDDGRVDLASGWAEFRKGNNLVEGDACVFEFIQGIGNGICVHIFRREEINCKLIPPATTAMVNATVALLTSDSDDKTKAPATVMANATVPMLTFGTNDETEAPIIPTTETTVVVIE